MKAKVIHLRELNNISSKGSEIAMHVIFELLVLLEVEMNCNQLMTFHEDIESVDGGVIHDKRLDIENDLDWNQPERKLGLGFEFDKLNPKLVTALAVAVMAN